MFRLGSTFAVAQGDPEMSFLDWFGKPTPAFVCPLCLGTAGAAGPCEFCNSELCAGSELEPLPEYLAQRSLEQLEAQLADAVRREQEAQGNKRFYARDYRRNIESLIEYKRRGS